uniref:Uncharacterized protein n=1 Tax=Arundo donax TaxID=35708 RepID=A0A0A9FPG6_ARUDO
MSRKRNVKPPTSSCSRMARLQRENEHLRGENTRLRGLERVVRALVAKGGEDFDALLQETATDSANSESQVGISKQRSRVDHDGIGLDNISGEDDDLVNQEGAHDYGHEGYDYKNGGDAYGYEGDESYDLWD